MSPQHSIDYCPICGGGLCGIRICGLSEVVDSEAQPTADSHGLIVCDECEAIWIEPDVNTSHQYPDVDDSRCPVCRELLWGSTSRWANSDDIASLGWQPAVNHDLDATSEG